MRLHEYQSKQILSRYDVPIPKGGIASSGNEAKQIAEELGGRVIIKSQVLVGGRGRAGGILLAKSSEEAERLATQILGMEIKGLSVNKVLVENAASIEYEMYIGITVNRNDNKCTLIASNSGGENIEEVALLSPDQIVKIDIDPLLGVQDFQIRNIAAGIDLPRMYWRQFTKIVRGLWQAYQDCDATLVEINPMVVTSQEQLLALDAKILLDDNALFRHVNLAEMRDVDCEDAFEIEARKYGLTYIKLDGEIGCLANGAGLSMTIMDLVKLCGGKPANFLDIGGNITAEKVMIGLRLLMDDENVSAILMNIFDCNHFSQEVVQGIRQIMEERNPEIPVVLRFVGEEVDGISEQLAGLPVVVKQSMFDAAQSVVSMIRVSADEHINQ